MQTLVDGVYTEDFDYGYPYDQNFTAKPPEFDYAGTVVSSLGLMEITPATFTLQYGSGPDNADAFLPYGGAIADNPHYLRYPVKSWGGQSALFLSVTTLSPTTLSFDRAFSGYVGDRLIVMVNQLEMLSISNSAGYSWTHTEIPLGRGSYKIVILLVNAGYSSTGVLREGTAQPTDQVTDLFRYLRITNLQVGSVQALPSADNTVIQLVGNTTLTSASMVHTTLNTTTWTASAALLYPLKLVEFTEWSEDSTFSVDNSSIGRWAKAQLVSQASMVATCVVSAHTITDSGGFVLATSATLTTESTAPQDIADLVRPLKQATLVMKRPVVVAGHPQTMPAMCETQIATILTDGSVSGKIDPYSPSNQIPTTVGATATYRWLSIDAQRSPSTKECIAWHAKGNQAAPFWSTPGAYRPTVDYYTMKFGSKIVKINYPAVQFDSAHLDHLNITLGNTDIPNPGHMTWVFVGSFTRFRGMLQDSCPIFDFAPDRSIDYTPVQEYTAIRRTFMPWTDNQAGASSIYLGLCSYGAADPTSSRIAWRTDDTANSYDRTGYVTLTDNTPMVIIYTLSTPNATVYAAPITPNGAQYWQAATLPRTAFDGSRTQFSLGKARVGVPFDGSFLTGSMNLLEVAFFPRVLTSAQAQTLATFYASLYAPITEGQITKDLTSGTTDATGEQFLIYADEPETELALVTGDRAIALGVFASETDGQDTIDSWNARGVPTVLCSNHDYATLLAFLEAE